MKIETIMDRAFDGDRRKAKRAANYTRKAMQKGRKQNPRYSGDAVPARVWRMDMCNYMQWIHRAALLEADLNDGPTYDASTDGGKTWQGPFIL